MLGAGADASWTGSSPALTIDQPLEIEPLSQQHAGVATMPSDEAVGLGERPGAARPGAKVLSLLHAMLLDADSIDDCDVLRVGETRRVLGHRVLAPSTLGTFLRSFTFGHVRQLDRVLGETLGRAWRAGAGPGAGRLVIDLDSF